MESPPPRGPGPVILATDVASLSATIARTESRGPRALRVRREHSILHALRVCLHARHPHRRGALSVAVVKLTAGASDSSDLDAFLDACERELGPVVVRCDADDAEDAAFVASEAHLVAVFANAADDDDDARRCPPRLLAALARARRGGAAIVAIGRTAIRAVGPDTTGADANDASRGRLENEAPALVPVVARVAEPAAASCSAAARDWRRLTRELRDLETSPSPETKVAASEVVGLGLVPGGCAACFADGTVEALVEDAVTFHKIASAEDRTSPRGALEAPAREKKHAEEKEQTAAFRRVVLRAGLAPFGGGVLAATSPVRDGEGEAAADGASLAPPPPPPRLKRTEARASEVFGADSPPESREADARFVSAEWWPFWSGARAAAAASVERAARLLARPSVSNVVFFTGAGASAESGMPAFRETVAGAADVDADGVRVGPATPLDALLPVWKTHDPEKYSTLSAFREDPTRCWFLHRKMFDQMRGLRPNDAHVAIETLAGFKGSNAFEVTVVTQNIDGLHQRAAADSRTSTETIELHGSTRRVECLDQCGWSEDAETFLREWDDATDDEKKAVGAEKAGSSRRREEEAAEEAEAEEARDGDGGRKRRRARASSSSSWISGDVWRDASRSNTRFCGKKTFPTCRGCGVAPAKPACVFFGEALPVAATAAARKACARAHAVVIVGTSLSVFPAADLPRQARVHTPRAPIVRVDASASATSTQGPDDAFVTGRAAAFLPRLVRRVLELRDGSRGEVAEDAEAFTGGIGRVESFSRATPRMFS